MADEDDDIIRTAMIETDKEIFGDAWGNPEGIALDETGDRSRETIGEGLEGELDDDDDDDEGDEDEGEDEDEPNPGEPKPEPKPGEPKPGERQPELAAVPPGRLRQQTERTRAAEAERDALRGQFEAMQAENRKLAESHAQTQALIQQLLQQRQQPQPGPQQTQQQPQGPPDMYEDPQGYAAYVQHLASAENRQLRAEMDANRVNMSMENARVLHKDAFDAAYGTLTKLDPQNPDNRELVRRIYASQNPGEAMVQWHRRNETLRRVGADPEAYEQRVREDARKQLMADPEFQRELLEGLRGQAVAGGRNEVRLPPSLNRANGGNSRAPNDLSIYDGSEGAIFASAFNN